MLHNTVGGDFDAHWVALLCSSSTAAGDESARDSPARSGAAVHTAHPLAREIDATATIGSDHDPQRRRWAAHDVTAKQGALARIPTCATQPGCPTAFDHRRP